LKREVIIVSTKLNKSAVQKPETVKLGPTNFAVSKIIMALMTSRKNPKVTIVIGIVSKTRTGFTIEFINARTAATMMAVNTPSKWTPGRSSEETITASALTMSWVRNFMQDNLSGVKVNENPFFGKIQRSLCVWRFKK